MKEILAKIWSYLSFKKQTLDGKKPVFNIRAMHTINKISIFMFLLALIFLLVKYLLK